MISLSKFFIDTFIGFSKPFVKESLKLLSISDSEYSEEDLRKIYNYLKDLINNFGKYYLLSYYRYDKSTNFRVDYMRNIEISNDSRKPIKDVSDLGDNFNISNYINNHIYMFGGKVIDAVVKLENEKSITYVIDWFGSDIEIFKEDNNTYAKIKCDDDALLHWLLQYSNYVKIEKPLYIKNKVGKLIYSFPT